MGWRSATLSDEAEMSLMRAIGILVLAAAFGCVQPDSAGNPEVPATHPLLSDSKCGKCRIVAETLAVLGQETDTIAINEGATPVVDSRGRFYLLEEGGASVLVFGPDGRLMRSFGRAGAGPGEFRFISEIHVSTGDTLFVIGGGVLHVIAPDYTHVRQSPLQEVGGAGFFNTILGDGRVLRMTGENQFGMIERNGTPSAPVMLQGADTAKCGDCGERTFREGIEPGTIWSGQQNKYRIEHHSLSGELLHGFTRIINWFPSWTTPQPGERAQFDIVEELSKPRMFGVRQSADGLLWTHILMVDDPDRIPVNDMMRIGQGIDDNTAAARALASDLMSNFVTMVEVIDPATRQVLATRELKMIVVPMLRDMVAQMKMDRTGDWTCVVMRLRLEGRS